ncbi:MAG TPA: hypothetical protein PLX02_03310 [Syntrophorhabdaceae bacterium]|nr:hypothetical protein [Syntrophorhabdaceae bacterium]HQM80627.1 hypothetical protein [Syntrophorhabdaceae bacterium]
MIKEIRFMVTGEIRKPKMGEWFLNTRNLPICAAQDFNTTNFPILKMEVVLREEVNGQSTPGYPRT